MADTSNKMTIIESGTEFDGTIKSQCGITLSGTLKGQISAPSLTVTATGSVNGKVNVAQLKAQGSVSGEIEAEAVELSGRVSDQTVIRAKTLEVMLTQPSGGLQVTARSGSEEVHNIGLISQKHIGVMTGLACQPFDSTEGMQNR